MVSINLLPEEVRRAQTRRLHLTRWSLAVAAALLLLAVPVGLDFLHRAQAVRLRGEEARLKRELGTVRNEVATVTAESAKVMTQIERARALRAKRAWSALFALIANALPEETWLTAVATDPATPAGARAEPLLALLQSVPNTEGAPQAQVVTIEAPRKLRLLGYAADYPQLYEFMAHLKACGAFTEVLQVRAGLEPVLTGSAVGFEVLCTW
ncbi:MAG TPA: hypothetical protein PKK06_11000 [Phycisphaerae bacterium]|nr:hypothetical protein [Phycisphaerae bacterium]HNU44343.1 hypothetical protein [Phycisphaerae bacterium]